MVFSRGADEHPGALAFDSLLRTAEGPAVMHGVRGHHARHARQVPADLGLHRPPEGGDQHAPHAVRQPADDCAGLALPRAREAGAGRLAAVEPHLRRQSQPEHGAAQRRHAVDRRGPAGAGADREDAGATCARCSRRCYFNVPRGLDMLLPLLEADRRAGAALLRAPARACSMPARRCRRPPGSGCRRWRATRARRAGVADHVVGLDRNLAGRHQRALEARPRRQHRRCRCRAWS